MMSLKLDPSRSLGSLRESKISITSEKRSWERATASRKLTTRALETQSIERGENKLRILPSNITLMMSRFLRCNITRTNLECGDIATQSSNLCSRLMPVKRPTQSCQKWRRMLKDSATIRFLNLTRYPSIFNKKPAGD